MSALAVGESRRARTCVWIEAGIEDVPSILLHRRANLRLHQLLYHGHDFIIGIQYCSIRRGKILSRKIPHPITRHHITSHQIAESKDKRRPHKNQLSLYLIRLDDGFAQRVKIEYLGEYYGLKRQPANNRNIRTTHSSASLQKRR